MLYLSISRRSVVKAGGRAGRALVALSALSLMLGLALVVPAGADTVTVTGTVLDQDGNPLGADIGVGACPAPGVGASCTGSNPPTAPIIGSVDASTGEYSLTLPSAGAYNVAPFSVANGVIGYGRSITAPATDQDFTFGWATLEGSIKGFGGSAYPDQTAGIGVCPNLGTGVSCPGFVSRLAAANSTFGPLLVPVDPEGDAHQYGAFAGHPSTPVLGDHGTLVLEHGQTHVLDLTVDPRIEGTVLDDQGQPFASQSGIGACPTNVTLALNCPGGIGAFADATGQYATHLTPAQAYESYNIIGFGAYTAQNTVTPPVVGMVGAAGVLMQDFTVAFPMPEYSGPHNGQLYTFTDTTRPTTCLAGSTEREIGAYVVWPTDEQLVALQADGEGTPLPLVVIAHGSGGNGAATLGLAHEFVSHGYVAVVPTFPVSSGRMVRPFDADCAREDVAFQAGDVSFLLDEVLAKNAQAGDELLGLIDPDRIGVGGDSAGGVTALSFFNTFYNDPRVKAVASSLGYAPTDPGIPPYDWTRPIALYMENAVADPFIPYAEAHAAYDSAGAPKFFVTDPDPSYVHGGTFHYPPGGGPAAVLAFADRYVKGDMSAETLDVLLGAAGDPNFEFEVESNVESLPAAVGDGYVTVAAPEGTTLEDVSTVDTAGLNPPVSFPAGLTSFTVKGVGPGETVQVQTLWPAGTSPNDYYKYQNGSWIDFSDHATFDGDIVTLTLTNGGPGDADGDPNNDEIVDPGGAVFTPPPPPPTTSPPAPTLPPSVCGAHKGASLGSSVPTGLGATAGVAPLGFGALPWRRGRRSGRLRSALPWLLAIGVGAVVLTGCFPAGSPTPPPGC